MSVRIQKIATLFVLAASLFASSAHAVAPSTYLVTKVVDGDTMDVKIGSKTERLRLIGMDTPETVDPRKPVQCFGKEAFARTTKLLLGKQVQLVADPTQGDRDKYGRLLRYVILDGINFNKRLITEGYAHEYTYVIPYKYQTEFKGAQKTAQADKKGLWSPTTCAGKTATGTKVSTSSTAKPKSPTITASTASPAVKKSDAGICHDKNSTYYAQTKKFIAYATVKACIASGGKLPKYTNL